MNKIQQEYAAIDNSLGHLLVQVDTFYRSLPEPVKRAYDRLGATADYGCHCDLEEGQAPDGCVLDDGSPQDCVYARKIGVKQQCEHWRPIIGLQASKNTLKGV